MPTQDQAEFVFRVESLKFEGYTYQGALRRDEGETQGLAVSPLKPLDQGFLIMSKRTTSHTCLVPIYTVFFRVRYQKCWVLIWGCGKLQSIPRKFSCPSPLIVFSIPTSHVEIIISLYSSTALSCCSYLHPVKSCSGHV